MHNNFSAAVALHNFIITEEENVQPVDRQYCPPGFADAADEDNGVWRSMDPSFGLTDIPHLTMAAQERLSKQMREDLKSYFNGVGQVDWQNERAGIVENDNDN